MVDMSFLYTYKSALYRVALDDVTHDPCTLHYSPLNVMRSLSELCGLRIVRDAGLLKTAQQTIPVELFETLMKAALLLGNDAAIEQLVSSWPWKILALRNFVLPIFCSINPLFCEIDLCEQMRRGVKHTTCLAHILMESLKRRDATKLRCLDLTGYPAAEVIVNYLASHVLLVYNEARQRQIIQVYNSVTQELPPEQKRSYSMEATFPDEQFVISIDAMVQSEDTHMELCRALSVSKLAESHLKLRIQKMDLSCLGVARIVVLLELVDSAYFTGISLQYNAITNQGLSVLGPVLKNLTSLTGLDLSCNNINVMPHLNGDSADVLSDVLASLPSLQRLNLSNNRTKGSLAKILSRVVRPLVMLRVAGCGLVESDVAYLAGSHHATALEELDVSDNDLSVCVDVFLPLLRRLASTLMILEAEDVGLDEVAFVSFFETCLHLRNLRLVNVARNDRLRRAVVIDVIAYLIMTPRLQAVKLSYPTDIDATTSPMETEEEEGQQQASAQSKKKEFSHLIDHVVSHLCHLHSRTAIRFAFKL